MDICTHKKDELSKHFDLISPLRIRDPQGFLFFPFVLTSRHVSLSHVSHWVTHARISKRNSVQVLFLHSTKTILLLGLYIYSIGLIIIAYTILVGLSQLRRINFLPKIRI